MDVSNILFVVSSYKSAVRQAFTDVLRYLLRRQRPLHDIAEIDVSQWEPRHIERLLTWMSAELTRNWSKTSPSDRRAMRYAMSVLRNLASYSPEGSQSMLSLEDLQKICCFTTFWGKEVPTVHLVGLIKVRDELHHQNIVQRMSHSFTSRIWLPALTATLGRLAQAFDDPEWKVVIDNVLAGMRSLGERIDAAQTSTAPPPQAATGLVFALGAQAKAAARSRGKDIQALQAVEQACAVIITHGGVALEAAAAGQQPPVRSHRVAAHLLHAVVLWGRAVLGPAKAIGTDGQHPNRKVVMGDEAAPLLAALTAELRRSPKLVDYMLAVTCGSVLVRHGVLEGGPLHLTKTEQAHSGVGILTAVLKACMDEAAAGTYGGWVGRQLSGPADGDAEVLPSIPEGEEVDDGYDHAHTRAAAQAQEPPVAAHEDSEQRMHIHALVGALSALLQAKLNNDRVRSTGRGAGLPHKTGDCNVYGWDLGTTVPCLADTLVQAAEVAMHAGDFRLGTLAAKALRSLARDEDAAQSLVLSIGRTDERGHAAGAGAGTPPPIPALRRLVQTLRSIVGKCRRAIRAAMAQIDNGVHAAREADDGTDDGEEDAVSLSAYSAMAHPPGATSDAGQGGLDPSVQAALSQARAVLVLARNIFAEVTWAIMPSSFNMVRHGGACVLQYLQAEHEGHDGLVRLLALSKQEVWARDALLVDARQRKEAELAAAASSATGSSEASSTSISSPAATPVVSNVPVRPSGSGQARTRGLNPEDDDDDYYSSSDDGSDDDDASVAGADEGLSIMADGELQALPGPGPNRQRAAGARRGHGGRYARGGGRTARATPAPAGSVAATGLAAADAGNEPAAAAMSVSLPRAADAFGHPLTYSGPNDLALDLRLHVAMWAPGKVKLTVLLPEPPLAESVSRDRADDLIRKLTAGVMQRLHGDIINWLWEAREDGTGSMSVRQAKKKAKAQAAAAQASGSGGQGPGVSLSRTQTFEAFVSDRAAGAAGAQRRAMDFDLPALVYPRSRPTHWRQRALENAGLALAVAAMGQGQAVPLQPALPASAGPGLERLLPDAHRFAAALGIIRYRLTTYSHVVQDKSRVGGLVTRAPVGAAPTAGAGNGPAPAAGGRKNPDGRKHTAQVVSENQEAKQLYEAALEIDACCKDAQVALVFEDTNASYRPSH